MDDLEGIDGRENRTLKFFLKGLRSLWELLGKEKKIIGFMIVLTALVSGLRLAPSYFLKLIFDEVPVIVSGGGIGLYTIVLAAGMLIISVVGLYIQNFVKDIAFLKSLIRLENLWPVEAQEKLLSLSLLYHERENTGQKIAKIYKGCEKLVDILANLFWGLLPPFLYLTINILVILVMDWKLGLMFLFPFIPAIIIEIKLYKRFIGEWIKWDEMKEFSSGLFCQSVINVQTVQNFVQEQREKQNLLAVRKNMEKIDMDLSRSIQKYLFAMGLVLEIFFVLTLLLGIYFVWQGQSSLGTVAYIFATGMASVQSVRDLVHLYTQMMRNLVSVVRMKELLDEEPDVQSTPGSIIPDTYFGQIEFRGTSFKYPGKDKPILEGVDLAIPSGKMTALVARSGEGKTTTIRLLARMCDVSEGQVLLDGKDIRELDLFWYRRLFAIVKQDVEIFEATLADNIKYPSPSSSDEQVSKAIEAAHLDVVVSNKERFPKGIQELVGERGVRLFGGERQRVGIARAYLALLNGARILILDEATSNLDSEAERSIQNMISKLRRDMSIAIVVIAHRPSTIQRADMIYVIDRGKIIEQGDHRRLVEKNGPYSKLVELQRLGDLRT